MQKILNINKWYYFIGLIITIITISFLTKSYLLKESFYYDILGEQMSAERIKDFITQNNKYEWVSFVFFPIFYLLKMFLITACLKTGLIFININISWRKILNWIIKLETIFLLPLLITLLWFLLINTDYSYAEFQNFYPFSLLNLFKPGELDQLFVYPMRIVNLFEIIYWLALARLFATETKLKFGKAIEFVMSTYGLGLLIWVVFVMFLTINMS